MMTRAWILAAGLALAGLTASAVAVTLQADTTEITEGAAITCTVTRADTTGDLAVQYVAGLPKVAIADVKASSSYGASLRNVTDGQLDTVWSNAGNSNSPHEGKDDAPFIAFTFDQAYALSTLRVANYVNPGHTFRCPKEVLIEVSADGTNFTALGPRKFRQGPGGKESVFEEFPLDGVVAKAVRLVIKTNYAGKVFGEGKSNDGANANSSVVGLAEVEFCAIGASTADLKALPGTVTIPAGKNAATFTVPTLDDQWIEGPEMLEVRLLPDAAYTVGTPGAVLVRVTDNDSGDVVSLTATTPATKEGGKQPGLFTITRAGTKGDLVVRYATSTVPVPISVVSCSDNHASAPPANTCDGNLQTCWCNTGNAERESEGTDDPWIIFTFDKVYTLGQMRVANYVNPGHTFRGIKEAEVLVATGMANFTSLGVRTFTRTADNAKIGAFEIIELGGVAARRVLFRVKSNHANKVFGEGKSYEGRFSNGSAVGLAEVEFLTGSTAGSTDYQERLTGTVTIPDGADHVTLAITPVDDKEQEGEETVILTLLPDNITYTVSARKEAVVTIGDND